MEVIFMLTSFLLLIGFSLNDVSGNGRWSDLLDGNRLSFLIILWGLVGFILRVHFSTFTYIYSGPEAVEEPLFGLKNMVLTGIPIVLILTSFLMKTREKRLIFFCLELALWVYIYLIQKGNYSWGFYGGGYYEMYDYIAMVLRMLLMLSLLNIREHRFSLAWAFALALMLCKLQYFSYGCF